MTHSDPPAPVPAASSGTTASGPLLTGPVITALADARRDGRETLACSLDLGRTTTTVSVGAATWQWQQWTLTYPLTWRPRTIYRWTGDDYAAVARYGNALVKLVPTDWGPPTFEIDGIKMLPTARVSPYDDAAQKVALVAPRGKAILDTCAGLGYFAAHCIEGGAASVTSYEKSPDVLWLRTLNPWSPGPDPVLTLHEGDVATEIAALPSASFDAVLHDPPRFGIAGELYSQAFYDQLARVLKRKGRLFHYTGAPNRLTSGRDVPTEVARRLVKAGFETQPQLDGVLATRR